MKLYWQGLGSIAAVLLLSRFVGLVVGAVFPDEASAAAAGMSSLCGVLLIGYLYRRWYGPLFGPPDRRGPVRLVQFSLGAATLLTLAPVLGRGSPLLDVTTLAGLGLLLVKVPINALGLVGVMFLGSAFYREARRHDPVSDAWALAVTCADSTTAQMAVDQLKADSIPARIQNLASLPGLEPGACVFVPASMLRQALELLSASGVHESELEQLAMRAERED